MDPDFVRRNIRYHRRIRRSARRILHRFYRLQRSLDRYRFGHRRAYVGRQLCLERASGLLLVALELLQRLNQPP